MYYEKATDVRPSRQLYLVAEKNRGGVSIPCLKKSKHGGHVPPTSWMCKCITANLAIQVLMAEYANRQQTRLDDLDPGSDAEISPMTAAASWAIVPLPKSFNMWVGSTSRLE